MTFNVIENTREKYAQTFKIFLVTFGDVFKKKVTNENLTSNKKALETDIALETGIKKISLCKYGIIIGINLEDTRL